MTDPTAAPAGVLTPDLWRLLRPRSVAIIGASATPGALGAGVWANLQRFGFAGALYLVNPRRTEIDGHPCLPDIDALPEGVDCAVLAIPGAAVLEAAAACARRGVGGLIIFSAGFAEMGAEGRERQAALAAIASAHGMAIAGPNCLGLINYVDGIPLTFSPAQPVPLRGRVGVGVVSQSGAMASVLRAALHARDIGISFSVSTGNEAGTGVEDFLTPLLDDPNTGTIVLVVEQFRAPRRFLELARRARASGRRIILLHPGRSAAARVSAQTHTGALAGDWQVMRTLVAQAGVLVADTLDTLIDLAEMLTICPALPGPGAAVITESGAFKAQMLDYCEMIGLALPPLSAVTQAALDAVMPEFAPPSNPLDLTAQALVDTDLYRATLVPFLEDDAYGAVVLAVILTNAAISRRKLVPIIAALRQLRPTKPVLFAMLGEAEDVPAELVAELRGLGVPFMRSAERAMRALACAGEGREAAGAASGGLVPSVLKYPLPRGVIPEYAAKSILAELGIAVPRGVLATDLAAAEQAAAQLGYPVALKAQSAQLSHKSDAGGVVLNLADPAGLAAGWARLHAAIAAARPGLVLDGVLVEAMGASGVEMILGARNDPDWGPVLLVGLGGIWAEALADMRVLPPDLGADAIRTEMLRLKGAALLRGLRGSKPVDLDAACRAVMALGALIRGAPEIVEIDINPLVLYPAGVPSGALALDALIVTQES